jgi:hypothetical protein
MKTVPLVLSATLLLAMPIALRADQPPGAQEAKISILSPKDGAELDAGESYPLEYAVVPGPGGDHFHVWVDGERGPGVHVMSGKYDLPKLTPGEHTITIKVVDKGHVPTGPEKTIKVRAEKE